MYYVNNKFADHGHVADVACQTREEADVVKKEIAEQIADLFRRQESDGEWEKIPGGRKYNAPENGYTRVGDAAYWEWYDRVLDDVGKDGILPEARLMEHCLDAVEITEDEDGDGDGDGDENTALHDAIIAGDAAAVRRAIADGADVNATVGAGGHSMLTIAARGCLGEMPDVVRALLDAGADVNPASGARPLYWAIMCGRPETVRLLLDAGATVTDDDRRNARDMVASSRAFCAGDTQDDMRAAAAIRKMSANIAKQLAA